MAGQSVVRLYHYTCEHALKLITESGGLRPREQPFFPELGPMIWLTDLEDPKPEQIGLHKVMLQCNRMAFRVVVESKAAKPWLDVIAGRGIDPMRLAWIQTLETSPEHWFVIRRNVPPSEIMVVQANAEAVSNGPNVRSRSGPS